MSFNFKNTELLRYHISKEFKEIKKRNDIYFETVLSSLISASFSFLSSQLVKVYLPEELSSFKEPVLLFVLFFVFFIVILYPIYKITNLICKKIRSSDKKKEKLSNKAKVLIDDFDHIACDSILIALEFKDQLDNLPSDSLKEFYFYEIVYYLDVSIQYTQKVFMNSNECINRTDKIDGIDLYRIQNVYEMMDEIRSFIMEYKNIIDIEPRLMPLLIYKLKLINESLDFIYSSYNQFLEKYIPDKLSDDLQSYIK